MPPLRGSAFMHRLMTGEIILRDDTGWYFEEQDKALGITPVDGRTARPLWVKGHLEPAGKGYRLRGTAK